MSDIQPECPKCKSVNTTFKMMSDTLDGTIDEHRICDDCDESFSEVVATDDENENDNEDHWVSVRNISKPVLIQAAGDWMHCPCGNTPDGGGFDACCEDGVVVEPDINWPSGWYLCRDCGQRYIDMTRTFKMMMIAGD